MSNICSNALFFDNPNDYLKCKSFIDKYDNLDFSLIVPLPKTNKDLLKEISDSVNEGEVDDYYLEKYNVKDLWKHIYWGNTWNHNVQYIDDMNVVTFETPWNPPYGIIKALWGQGLAFKFYYGDDADNVIHDLHMSSNIEMDSSDIDDNSIILSMARIFSHPQWVIEDEN